jgi:hypothetical protein
LASRINILERRQRIELPTAEVFVFYGDALNLKRTPRLCWASK